MSLNKIIKAAIGPITGVCSPDFYRGRETEYCTFNYSELPVNHADDAPQMILYLVQVHWFLPNGQNPLPKKRQIKRALFKAGFTYPEVENASDQDGQHYVFECEYVEGEGVDGEAIGEWSGWPDDGHESNHGLAR